MLKKSPKTSNAFDNFASFIQYCKQLHSYSVFLSSHFCRFHIYKYIIYIYKHLFWVNFRIHVPGSPKYFFVHEVRRVSKKLVNHLDSMSEGLSMSILCHLRLLQHFPVASSLLLHYSCHSPCSLLCLAIHNGCVVCCVLADVMFGGGSQYLVRRLDSLPDDSSVRSGASGEDLPGQLMT